MPYREESYELVAAPPAFPLPVEGYPVDVATIGIDDEVVGWLVRQQAAIAWFSNVPPTGWKGGMRALVEATLAEVLDELGNAADAWVQVLARTHVTDIELDVDYGELLQRIRVAWGVE